MANVLSGLTPSRFFKYFEEISAIPRMSLHEEKIADHIENFARERSLFCVRDNTNNVFVRLPASSGRENDPAILMQGHTDMVCECNAGTEHDFMNDGLDLYIDGDFIKAKGTTLGADNGVAVAMMLAALDGEYPSHPTIECLFTSGEEIGLVGAGAFDYSLINARKMINLDSAEEGFVTVGCAGGVRSSVLLSCNTEDCSDNCVRITISGLVGGHSGEDINKNRHSANALIFRILRSLFIKNDIRIVSVNGGDKDNAITREACAVVACKDADAMKNELLSIVSGIRSELAECDRDMVVCTSDENSSTAFDKLSTERIIACGTIRTGVMKMSAQIPGLVEFSRNLGSVRTSGNDVEFIWSTRSPKEPQLDSGEEEITLTAQLCEAKEIKHYNRYPGWNYPGESKLCDSFCNAFKKLYDRDVERLILHAGLECGLAKEAIPDMDIISVGPDEIDIHSPNERLGIASTQRLCSVIAEMMK